MTRLLTTNHDRDSAGLTYIYPVLSRRAGGLSIGVNFNTNNACNWQCVYCQVPNLRIGAAPALDFELLADELRFFLNDVQHGDFYQRFQVADNQKVIKDIAFSGNGEPTSVADFAKAVALIGDIATEAGVFPDSRYVLITNGSLIHLPKVQAGLQMLNNYGGEVWFKLDSATAQGRQRINHTRQSLPTSLRNIRRAAALCCTKIQTCLFTYNNQGWTAAEKAAYLDALHDIKATTNVQDIMLYTLARPSFQPEAAQLAALPSAELNAFADDIRALGFTVSVS